MKKVSRIKRWMALSILLCLPASLVWADGESTEVYLSGTTNSAAGDFVVQTTEEMFHFQGNSYDVFKVYYDNPEMNMEIAVNNEGRCTSFVAYNGEFLFFYTCNKYGFGVRKVMFSNPWVKDGFDARQFHDQSVLLKQKKVEKKQAVGLIAAYVPQMKG